MRVNLHEKVTQYITEGIESGKYKVGDQIPTEHELAAGLGISRPTVRHALGLLTAAGQLTRIKGRGTFVTEPKVLHQSTSFVASYRTESQATNQKVDTKVLSLCVERTPDNVASAMKLPIGIKSIKLVRLRSLDGYNNSNPVVYTTLYVPQKLFPEMVELDFNEISFYDAMDSKGLSIKQAQRKLEVIQTPEKIASYLKISTFEPSIFISSVGMTENGAAVEYSESYYPAGCSSFMIEVNR